MRSPHVISRSFALTGGLLAVAAGTLLAVVLIVRHLSLGVLNGITIFGALFGGYLALARPHNKAVLAVATITLLIAAVPALVGGLGLVLLPSILLLLIASLTARGR